jgi:hypothetical protein
MRFQRQSNFAKGLLNLSSSASKAAVTIVALALIGACGFYIWHSWTKPPEGSPTKPLAAVFECEKCHETKKFDDADLNTMGREAFRALIQAGIDCPKCGGTKTMRLTLECPDPKCGQHYLPAPFGQESVCPKCGLNYSEGMLKFDH